MKRLLVSIASAVLLVTAAAPAWAATDPYRSKQWGLTKIRAEQAWSASQGSGITIAIVDTGIDLTHPDLKNKIASHYTCIDTCRVGGDDDHGHGSHVAGIAAASTSNGIGVAGVAPSAKLMAVKVLASDGSGYCSDIDLGIRWAADHGADVINLSLSPELFGLDLFCGLQDAAEYAYGKGVVVVVAAGNDGLVNLYGSSAVIVVGATGPNDEPASYSNSGADIYAPGGNSSGSSCTTADCIYSTWKDGKYAVAEGTSMAAPHVSGLAALLLARGYSKTQILSRLRSTADNVDGILRVNAARAVGAAGSTPPKPTPKKSSPATTSRPRSSTGAPGTPSESARPSVLPTKLTSPAAPASASASPSQSGTPLASAPTVASRGGALRPAVIAAGSVALLLAGFATVRTLRRRRV